MFCGVGLWWAIPPNKIHRSYWNRLHSEIYQIHLSIEAQCGTALLPLGDCHTTFNGSKCYAGYILINRQRALRVHFITKIWSCHNTFITNSITTKFLYLNALRLMTFFTSWSSPNLGHNMIPRLECSEVIVSKCLGHMGTYYCLCIILTLWHNIT